MTVKVYVSGPMRGYEKCNYPAFADATERLRAVGIEVLSPHEFHNGSTTLSFAEYMKTDLAVVCTVDEVTLLPGWEGSEGVWYELLVAQAVNCPVTEFFAGDYIGAKGFSTRFVDEPLSRMTFSPLEKPSPSESDETILEEAQRLVYGDRGDAYGHPAEDFGRTAKMWSAILEVEVTAQQVAMAMICVKMSRQMNKPRRDNAVDIAGYAATLQMVVEYEAEHGV